MDDQTIFERYREHIRAQIGESEHGVLPLPWWDTVIRYYYDHGYSEERAVRAILEVLDTGPDKRAQR